jgi:hypothetical protein
VRRRNGIVRRMIDITDVVMHSFKQPGCFA